MPAYVAKCLNLVSEVQLRLFMSVNSHNIGPIIISMHFIQFSVHIYHLLLCYMSHLNTLKRPGHPECIQRQLVK